VAGYPRVGKVGFGGAATGAAVAPRLAGSANATTLYVDCMCVACLHNSQASWRPVPVSSRLQRLGRGAGRVPPQAAASGGGTAGAGAGRREAARKVGWLPGEAVQKVGWLGAELHRSWARATQEAQRQGSLAHLIHLACPGPRSCYAPGHAAPSCAKPGPAQSSPAQPCCCCRCCSLPNTRHACCGCCALQDLQVKPAPHPHQGDWP